MSVISLGDVERDITQQQRIDPAFANTLTLWLERTATVYSERILPVTVAVARLWGRLTIALGRTDADILIAATALEHDLVVATRNIKHFQSTGVKTINPFQMPAR